MVCTLGKLGSPPGLMVLAMRVSLTANADTGMGVRGSRSVRVNTTPVSGGAGRNTSSVFRPLCTPTPTARVSVFSVRWRIMRALSRNPCGRIAASFDGHNAGSGVARVLKRHGLGAGLDRLLVDAVAGVGAECAALARLDVHERVDHVRKHAILGGDVVAPEVLCPWHRPAKGCAGARACQHPDPPQPLGPPGTDTMPLIQVSMFPGRTAEQKRAFAQALTDAAVRTIGATPGSVDIIFTEVRRDDWATAGRLWSDPQPAPQSP